MRVFAPAVLTPVLLVLSAAPAAAQEPPGVWFQRAGDEVRFSVGGTAGVPPRSPGEEVLGWSWSDGGVPVGRYPGPMAARYLPAGQEPRPWRADGRRLGVPRLGIGPGRELLLLGDDEPTTASAMRWAEMLDAVEAAYRHSSPDLAAGERHGALEVGRIGRCGVRSLPVDGQAPGWSGLAVGDPGRRVEIQRFLRLVDGPSDCGGRRLELSLIPAPRAAASAPYLVAWSGLELRPLSFLDLEPTPRLPAVRTLAREPGSGREQINVADWPPATAAGIDLCQAPFMDTLCLKDLRIREQLATAADPAAAGPLAAGCRAFFDRQPEVPSPHPCSDPRVWRDRVGVYRTGYTGELLLRERPRLVSRVSDAGEVQWLWSAAGGAGEAVRFPLADGTQIGLGMPRTVPPEIPAAAPRLRPVVPPRRPATPPSSEMPSGPPSSGSPSSGSPSSGLPSSAPPPRPPAPEAAIDPAPIPPGLEPGPGSAPGARTGDQEATPPPVAGRPADGSPAGAGESAAGRPPAVPPADRIPDQEPAALESPEPPPSHGSGDAAAPAGRAGAAAAGSTAGAADPRGAGPPPAGSEGDPWGAPPAIPPASPPAVDPPADPPADPAADPPADTPADPPPERAANAAPVLPAAPRQRLLWPLALAALAVIVAVALLLRGQRALARSRRRNLAAGIAAEEPAAELRLDDGGEPGEPSAAGVLSPDGEPEAEACPEPVPEPAPEPAPDKEPVAAAALVEPVEPVEPPELVTESEPPPAILAPPELVRMIPGASSEPEVRSPLQEEWSALAATERRGVDQALAAIEHLGRWIGCLLPVLDDLEHGRGELPGLDRLPPPARREWRRSVAALRELEGEGLGAYCHLRQALAGPLAPSGAEARYLEDAGLLDPASGAGEPDLGPLPERLRRHLLAPGGGQMQRVVLALQYLIEAFPIEHLEAGERKAYLQALRRRLQDAGLSTRFHRLVGEIAAGLGWRYRQTRYYKTRLDQPDAELLRQAQDAISLSERVGYPAGTDAGTVVRLSELFLLDAADGARTSGLAHVDLG